LALRVLSREGRATFGRQESLNNKNQDDDIASKTNRLLESNSASQSLDGHAYDTYPKPTGDSVYYLKYEYKATIRYSCIIKVARAKRMKVLKSMRERGTFTSECIATARSALVKYLKEGGSTKES
jgi:hypothetical protein